MAARVFFGQRRAATAAAAAGRPSPPRLVLRWLGRLTVAATVGAVGYCAYDEGVRRSVYCTYEFLPVAWAYYQFNRRTDFADEAAKAAAKAALDREYAQVTLGILLRLKGYYIKMGQTCVGAGLLPKEYDRVLGATLLDSVPPEPFEVVEAIVKAELGVDALDEVFESFSETPLGAASIGQVHAATLKDGRDVVVKVQYPSVEKLFFVDVMTMKLFCAMYDDYGDMMSDLVDAVAKTFVDEFDYRREAANMTACRENMKRSGGRYPMNVRIPAAVEDLCTTKVLVMEKMPGVPIRKHMRDFLAGMAAKAGMSADAYMEKLQDDYMAAVKDPAGGSALTSMTHALAQNNAVNAFFLDVFSWCVRAKHAVLNALRYVGNRVLLCPEGAPAFEYTRPTPVLNVFKIVETLFAVHAQQVFEDGVFNSDPHAGNILVDGGDLVLLDYGAVGRMTEAERRDFAELIVAIADGDDTATVRAYRGCGGSSKHNHEGFLLAYALMCFHRGFYAPDLTRLNVLPPDWDGNWLTIDEHLNKVDKIGHFPGYFIMIQRLGQVLLGLGAEVGVSALRPLSLAEMWRGPAEAFLSRCGEGVEAAAC
eukprot:TRINITY_DN32602_c0_g1_i1.p1 TRINITY_DN32602_c0_g1~~TRINITY_DN32602_c0_g1_i1.p1  ORF type:complete len:592 (+),score=237.86 TRINITY_DN32602_c0_g1_i1:36-1811(+)